MIGASGGIGQAVVKSLLADGVHVTALSRMTDGLDVTDPVSVDRHLQNLDGPYDLIFVATGILAPDGHAPEKSLEAIDARAMADTFAANAIGPALVLRHAPRLLPKAGRAVCAVLTARVGSIGDNGLGGWYAYRASKAAANQITRTAAIEIGRKRKDAIVVALHPGTVETPFTAGYPGHRKVTGAQAAANLLSVVANLTPDQSGGFFDYAGDAIPW